MGVRIHLLSGESVNVHGSFADVQSKLQGADSYVVLEVGKDGKQLAVSPRTITHFEEFPDADAGILRSGGPDRAPAG